LPGKDVDKVKKILVTLMCLVALLGALCVTVSATAEEQPMTRQAAVTETARKSYYRSLYQSGKESLHGFCGLMTSGQLYALDINNWRVVNDGNKQFDYYAAMDVTTGGYYVKPYYLEEYSMSEALNHISRFGTKDVYNILVGFQWTNTAAGSKYGHAVLINGIIDGTVYFVESFDLSLDRLYLEGSVITCSIPEFVAYYENWATYEGIIWFGNGEFADCCEEYGADLTIEATLDISLRSQPCMLGRNDCVALRRVAVGEQMRATGILVNPRGNRFYRVTDGDTVAYIPETAAAVARLNPDDLSLVDLNIPGRISRGGAVKMAGAVQSTYTQISAVEITVSDMQGRQLLSARQECDAVRQELSKLSLGLDTQYLPEGAYLVQVYGECQQHVPQEDQIGQETARVRLAAQMMLVGDMEHEGQILPVMNKVLMKKAAA